MSPSSHFKLPSSPEGRTKPKSPFERLSESEEERWDSVYRPWAVLVGKKLIGRRPRLTLLALVQRVIDQNHGIPRVSYDFGLSAGTVLENLKDGLDLYIAQEREKKLL